MADLALTLWENLARGDTPIGGEGGDITPHFPSWWHSTRERGGNWQAEGAFKGTKEQAEAFFFSNLGRRIKAGSGGKVYWEGQIVEMTYTKADKAYVRSMLEMANRIKVIYSKVGPQLLQNGDVEGGAWGTVGTPSTIETTTSWWAKGTTSMHCVTDAGGEGMEIEDSSAGASWSISASTRYTCSAIVNVVSGTWTLTIYQSDGTTVLAQRATSATGREWLQCQINETNSYTGTVIVHLTASSASEEIYADGAMFHTSPVRSETKWYEDTDSIGEWGRIEGIFLEREMTDDEADAMAARELAKRAWPRTRGPERGGTGGGAAVKFNSLTVTLMGMSWTLTWRHALTDGTDQADNHATALLDESEFITSANAFIDANTAEVLIKSDNPEHLWRCLEKVLEVGDGSGGLWMGGVYPGRKFRYEARPTVTQYQVQGDRLTLLGGGEVDPLEVAPGWAIDADMPLEPTPAGATSADDPRRAFLTEVKYVYQGGRARLEWTWDRES